MYERLNKVTFMTSENCNLKCSYCEIAKNNNNCHLEEHNKIKEALSSGLYVTTYQHIFNKYNINVEQITDIELWGQEPTLTLNEFSSQLPRILKWLPNVNTIFFSTNGVAFPDRIINFINVVNKYLKDYEKRKIKIIIQFSFDGFKYQEKQRGIKPEVILNNIKKIAETLNDTEIVHNLDISFHLHGVVTLEMIQEFIDDNSKLIEHIQLIEDFLLQLRENNKNKQIRYQSFSNFLAFPQNATKEDGENLKLFAEIILKEIDKNYNFNRHGLLSPFTLMSRGINTIQTELKETSDILEHNIDNFNFDYEFNTNNRLIGNIYGCGVGFYDIKMRYDGTLLYCQNTIFGIQKEDLEGKIGIEYDIQRDELAHPVFQPNLLTSSYNDVEKFINIFDIAKHYSYNHLVSNVVNLMYLLIQTNQIDSSYKDNPDKILRHALYIAMFIQCFYNNLIYTGSLYSLWLGAIRFYCNGALDVIEQYLRDWSNMEEWT